MIRAVHLRTITAVVTISGTLAGCTTSNLLESDSGPQAQVGIGNLKPVANVDAPKVAEPDNEGTANPDPNGYKPKTRFDNTPYRFNMHQDGKKMTADEFDAWMKSRGLHVAKGASGEATHAASAAPASAEVASQAKGK